MKYQIEKLCPYLVRNNKPGGEIDSEIGIARCETGGETVDAGELSTPVVVCIGYRLFPDGFEFRPKSIASTKTA